MAFKKVVKNKSGRKITNDEHPEIIRLYHKDLWTLEKIGEYFGVSRERIRQILVKNGSGTRTYKEAGRMHYQPINIAEVLEFARQPHQSTKTIAEKFDIGVHRVKHILYENGIELNWQPKPRITKQDLHRLYIIEGKSQVEIGKIYDTPQTNISRYVIKYGLQKPNKRRK